MRWLFHRKHPEVPPLTDWENRSRTAREVLQGSRPATREVLEVVLLAFAESIRPWETLEEREATQQAWIEAATPEWLDLLISILRDPPAEARDPVWQDEWYFRLEWFLGQIGHRFPEDALPRLGPLLHDQRYRLQILNVFAEVATPDGLPWLAPLVEAADLSEDERVALVDAIGKTQVLGARTLLERMWQIETAPVVRSELQVYLGSMRWQEATGGSWPVDLS